MLAMDWTVNVGHLLQIFAIVGGGLWMFFTLRSDVRVLKIDVHNLERTQEHLTEAFNQLGTILTQVAVQDNRLGMMEKSIDELRHGQGFIRVPSGTS